MSRRGIADLSWTVHIAYNRSIVRVLVVAKDKDLFMKTLGMFMRIPAVLGAAGVLLICGTAQAALVTSNGTGLQASTAAWICMAVFVLGTLGVAFWNSNRKKVE